MLRGSCRRVCSDSCERAAVMVTPRTWVLKFDEPGCKNGFKLDFRYHGNEYEYTAEKMELRAPSEHKIDHAPADMEAQFYFYDDEFFLKEKIKCW